MAIGGVSSVGAVAALPKPGAQEQLPLGVVAMLLDLAVLLPLPYGDVLKKVAAVPERINQACGSLRAMYACCNKTSVGISLMWWRDPNGHLQLCPEDIALLWLSA